MRVDLFNELLESVKEGGAILRVDAAVSRETSFEDPGPSSASSRGTAPSGHPRHGEVSGIAARPRP